MTASRFSWMSHCSMSTIPWCKELFPDSLLETEQVRMGYRGSAASRAAGITYRQLDYWAHKHIVEPSVTASHGSGSRRLYSFNDVLMLAACKKLLDLGVNLQNISQTLQFLRAYRSTQLSHMVIVCDGEHVRACEGETMFADVLQHESAVFIIAVGALFRQVESSLAAAESVAVTSDVALRHLSVDSDTVGSSADCRERHQTASPGRARRASVSRCALGHRWAFVRRGVIYQCA